MKVQPNGHHLAAVLEVLVDDIHFTRHHVFQPYIAVGGVEGPMPVDEELEPPASMQAEAVLGVIKPTSLDMRVVPPAPAEHKGANPHPGE